MGFLLDEKKVVGYTSRLIDRNAVPEAFLWGLFLDGKKVFVWDVEVVVVEAFFGRPPCFFIPLFYEKYPSDHPGSWEGDAL